MKDYYVYILSSKSKTLYVGVTSNLEKRVREHKLKLVGGFTAKYNIDQLVYYEVYPEATQAIAREKQIKGKSRAKKVALIESENPEWKNLAQNITK